MGFLELCWEWERILRAEWEGLLDGEENRVGSGARDIAQWLKVLIIQT